MLSVGFIFPSSDYLYDPFRGDPHTHFQILTVLEDHFGNNVELNLIDLRGIKREFAFYHIPECDAYLYSLYTLDYDELVSIARHLRERYPHAKHITGGPHAAVFPEECLKIFDAVIIGDGEESIIRAITAVAAGEPLERIYRQERPLDINQYPFPRRHYLPASTVARKGILKLKVKEGYDQLLSTTVMFSRGCPYQCAFCAMPSLRQTSPGIRYRSPERVADEIAYLKREYKMEGISLLDELAIPLKHEDAVAHLEAIGRSGIVWRGQTRVDCLSPEIARLAKESGCAAMSLGVESASQRALDTVNKKISVEKSKETIRLLRANGIESRIYLVCGLPGESENIVQETLDFLDETQPDLVTLSLFTVRPGTLVYQNPKRYGIKAIGSNWKNTMHMKNRYGDEEIALTFQYDRQTPWGKGLSQERIIENYKELLARINERGISSAIFTKAA